MATKISSKAITQEDVALFLARRKRKRGKPVVKGTPRDFVAEFSASNLRDVLKDREKKPITLGWVIKKMLRLLDDENAKVSDKVVILDRLKDHLLLGAIQDPELAEAVTKRVSGENTKKRYDPFKAGKLKVVGGS